MEDNFRKMEQQEYMMKLQMIQQEAQALEEKLQTIDQQIQEMEAIKASLIEIDKKDSNEFLANLGKGIFIKTEIKEKELFVNIGKNTLVKKDPKETITIIEDQTQRLFIGKEEVMGRIEQIQQEMHAIIMEAQQAQTKEEGKPSKK